MRHLRQVLRTVCAVALASAVAACGSGGISNLPAVHASSVAAPSSAKILATIRIAIPKRNRHGRIHGHYVSSATQSIAIAVTPKSGPVLNFNADLTPATNSNCVAGLISPLICTIALSLPPGSYTATFATYDGLLQGGNAPNNPPSGNELSAHQSVPLTIATGKPNAISVVLDGIPTGVALVPDASAGMSGNMSGGFSLSKCFSSAKVSVLGVDAGNNYILGPGAPVPSLTSNDTAHVAVATPAPSAPNQFRLSRPNLPSGNSVVKLTAKVTPAAASGGALQSADVNITFTGDICGVFTEFAVPTASSGLFGIGSGPDQAMWFTENSQNKIGRIPTSATTGSPGITEYALATGLGPEGITTGPDGNLWFTETANSQIGTSTPGGTITEFATGITSGSSPESIVTGPDGALWFDEVVGNKIGRIPTSATANNPSVSEYAITTPGSFPADITNGPDGALWFTECAVSQLGRITTGGTISFEAPTFTPSSQPFGIVTGPDGALWYTEFGISKIGKKTVDNSGNTDYAIPTAGSYPEFITVGPDGAMWFTENSGNKIGRITTAGAITEFTIPTANALPVGIAKGPDGAVWFVERGGNKIGRLQ